MVLLPTNIAWEAKRKKNYTHTPEMSDMWWPSQKPEETKKKQKDQRPLPKSIAKPLRKPKKTKKTKAFTHYGPWGALVGQEAYYYRGNPVYGPIYKDFRDNTYYFLYYVAFLASLGTP